MKSITLIYDDTREVQVIQMNPMRLSMTIVSDSPLDTFELEEVKKELQEILGEEIELELSVAIKL